MATDTTSKRISSEQVSQLAAKYGRVKHVVYNGHDFVFRKPKRQEAQEFLRKSNNESEKHLASEQLAQLVVVHCSGADDSDLVRCREKFIEMLEEYPALSVNSKVGAALAQLAGISEDETLK